MWWFILWFLEKYYRCNDKYRSLSKTVKELESKFHYCLSHHWVVSVGLSDPIASTRSVASWCREFAIDVQQFPISHASVASVRDAFGNILLKMNREDAKRYGETAKSGFLVVRHLHDEATMRLRSEATSAPASAGPRRGKYSKIQNAVVDLHRSSSPDTTSSNPQKQSDTPHPSAFDSALDRCTTTITISTLHRQCERGRG